MPVLILLAAVGVCIVLRVRRGGDSDAPARAAAAAAHWLPAHRTDWGHAMVAELAHVSGRMARWRIAAGVLRLALFPPVAQRGRVLAVAGGGLALVVGASAATDRELPDLSVFVTLMGLLLCGCTTLVASRSPRPPRSAGQVFVAALALLGVAAAILAVVSVAVTHPAAAIDPTHLFSVVFAVALTGCLALAWSLPRRRDHADTALWWGLAGALACGAVWTIIAMTIPVTTEGIARFVLPAAAAATLTVSICAATVSRSGSDGVRAGLLTIILGAPVHIAIDLSVILHLHHYTLTNPYDIAAYPHSGSPDVASYIFSDAVGGNILAGLLLYPLILLVVAMAGAGAVTGLQRLTGRRPGPAAA
jgi:hypothetical protein